VGDEGGMEAPRLETLAANIVEQGDRVASLLMPMDSIVETLDGGTDEMGRRLLLAPMEDRDLILRPRDGGRTTVGSPTPSTSDPEIIRPPPIAELELEMGFVSDVLSPVLPASRALALDLDINFDVAYGAGGADDLPGVILCPRSLREAVVNGLDNAIKYVRYGANGVWGEENIRPMIRVTLVSNDDDDDDDGVYGGETVVVVPGVTIWIEDNGPGVREEERDRVFLRGYRSDAARVASRGSGIGLDISKAIILKMGGTLDFVDEGPGRLGGAVMRIVLFREQRQSFASKSVT